MKNILEFHTSAFRDDKETMAMNVNLIEGKALCEAARAALRKAGFKAGDIWDEDHGWAFYAKEFKTKKPGPYYLVTGALQAVGEEDVDLEDFVAEGDSFFAGEEIHYPVPGSEMWATLIVGRVRYCKDQLLGRNKQRRDCRTTAALLSHFHSHQETLKVEAHYV